MNITPEQIAALIVTLRKASWRESVFTTPNPDRHVALCDAYDALVEHLGVTGDQINDALEKAGL